MNNGLIYKAQRYANVHFSVAISCTQRLKKIKISIQTISIEYIDGYSVIRLQCEIKAKYMPAFPISLWLNRYGLKENAFFTTDIFYIHFHDPKTWDTIGTGTGKLSTAIYAQMQSFLRNPDKHITWNSILSNAINQNKQYISNNAEKHEELSARYSFSNHIPTNVESLLLSPHCHVAINSEATDETPPHIFVKIDEEIDFLSLKPAVTALEPFKVKTTSYLLLRLTLWDSQNCIRVSECVLDKYAHRHILKAMSFEKICTIIGVQNPRSGALCVIGQINIEWTKDHHTLIMDFFRITKHNPHSMDMWKTIQRQYYQQHPQNEKFSSRKLPQSLATQASSPPNQKHVIIPPTKLPSLPVTDFHQSLQEKFRESQRSLAEAEYKFYKNHTKRSILYHLQALALEDARCFFWGKDATDYIEELPYQEITRQTSWMASNRHIWFEFEQSISILACANIAAIFIFSARDQTLFSKFIATANISIAQAREIRTSLYYPEKKAIIVNLIDITGNTIWTMTTYGQIRSGWTEWSISLWHKCPTKSCYLQAHVAPSNTLVHHLSLCDNCKKTRRYLEGWLNHSWLGILGSYRESDDQEDSLKIQSIRKHAQQTDTRQVKLSTNQYQYIRYMDLLAPHTTSTSPQQKRPSWVKVLRETNPDLIREEQRIIPEKMRTLKAPRFAKFREKHGTNQTKVKEHTRTIVSRSDRKTTTRVSAKKAEKRD